jgi:hypothetical protein
MADTLDLIKNRGVRLFLFVGKRSDDGDEDISVMATRADSESEAEELFMKALGSDSDTVQDEEEKENACITLYELQA